MSGEGFQQSSVFTADNSNTGMPARIADSMASQLSVANFIGGTTKQFELEINGLARNLSSPPAIMYISSAIFVM